ncbi:unnamed protein product [Periconia digitata]|uniref:Endopolyphosphatase n=1 Tax=Periconia digitata TaxID=1303443 RepID=A0A9W4U4P4_9PLEO|nr:unnamed protein product [Periconia digitata]
MRYAVLWGLAYCAAGWGVDAAAALEDGHRLDVHPVRQRANAGTIGLDHTQTPTARRRLHGRFLHITDFHPDPFYKTYSSTAQNAACHRKRGPAGYYGAETSGCDSPLSLVNATMDWIKHNIADDIDFVVWTGDSARHDNDDGHPRTRRQIVQQNELMVEKFVEVFGTNKGGHGGSENAFRIPIVPTFGNNDIMPHNILLKGPNEWTKKYLNIWTDLVPEAQKHQFQQGGWFWVEVIPGKLAVISLNTMYFFTSNPGVDGCANKHEPGYEQFEWLRIQLQLMRDRGVSAILIGHVPPARVNSKESWEETCWQKYTLWERQFRDVIVTSLFGHMNVDHFMLQDSKQLKKSTKNGKMASKRVRGKEADVNTFLEDGEVTVASASDYLLDLRKRWAKLPSPPAKKSPQSSANFGEFSDEDEEVDSERREEEEQLSTWQRVFGNLFSRSKKGGGKNGGSKKPKKGKSYLEKIGGKYAERYSVSLVSPSIVPNYFPTIRIFTYNTTGLEDGVDASTLPLTQSSSSSTPHNQSPLLPSPDDFDTDNPEDDSAYLRYITTSLARKQKDKESLQKSRKRRKYKFKVPEGPSKSSPPGPAYSPQPLTLLGYTQYFANLTRINNDFVAAGSRSMSQSVNEDAPRTIFGLKLSPSGPRIEPKKWKEGKHHKHQGKKPRPEPHPKEFSFEIEYDTRDDKRYKLRDLTVRQWVNLARRIGQDGKRHKNALIPLGEVEDEEQEEDDDDSEIDVSGKGKKGRKHKKGKKKKHGDKELRKSVWFTFVKRAFVGSMDPREIEEVFCSSSSFSGVDAPPGAVEDDDDDWEIIDFEDVADFENEEEEDDDVEDEDEEEEEIIEL